MIDSSEPSENPVEEARYEAAADWLQRLDDPDVKDEDLRAWLEWFDASDENRWAFEQLQPLYRRLHDLPRNFRRDARRRFDLRPRRWGGRGSTRLGFWTRVTGLAAAILIGVFVWRYGIMSAEAVYSAPANQHRTIELTDRSALVLGADSVVAVKYTTATRFLSIERGEAYFEVAHNVKRPFIVQAGNVRITAVGTEFNVQRDADQVVVTVTEGVVEVRRDGAPPDVAPSRVTVGERLVLPVLQHAHTAPRGESTPGSTWHNGQIEFVNAPLSQVLGVIDPYAPRHLIIEDPRVADLTFSGTVFRDHIDEWIASLPRVYAIRAVPLDDGALSFVTRAEADTAR
jgi:transmembrane sensor